MMDLTPRHRAMLQEIGVPLWLPEWPSGASTLTPAAAAPQETATLKAGMALPVRDMAALAPRPAATGASSMRHDRSAPAKTPAAASHAITGDDFKPRPTALDWSQVEWPALTEAAAQCQACRLCTHRTQTVFGVGTEPAPSPNQPLDWLVVGEGPGEQEDLRGEPFVGAAGQLLDHMLAAMQLARRREREGQPSLYITNVVKCRPPGNRNPLPDEIEACSAYLQAQIRLLKPRFILAMGRFAAQTLLRESVPSIDTLALGKLRGTVHRHGEIPVVVSYHPAYLLRNPAEKAKSWADLCLALQAWDATNLTK